MASLLQVKTGYGAWLYVRKTRHGYAGSIYPTDALDACELEKAQAAFPCAEFRAEPPCLTSPDAGAREMARAAL
ncbi:MAG: hypothetical protein PHF20_01500 [Halothiobacillaceae bacterium]|nr:hypothetical protein [Halothiobacillaceae bacterium]